MNNRRKFFKHLSLGVGGVILSTSSGIALNNSEDHTPSQKNKSDIMENKKLGIALVGLGNYSTNQLAPALQQTKNCYLAGVVTGTPSKEKEWMRKYNIPQKNVYNYDNFDTIKDNPDIDIIYVVLPNSMHAEYTIRAAKAGKHVICEKPMAISAEECEQMIDACKKADKKLSIGYRLHFEPFNQEMMRLGEEKVFGNIKSLKAENGFEVTRPSWRTDKKMSGGGPLTDLGIYCVQGVIYTARKLPIAVTAQFGKVTKPSIFHNVEQSIAWQLEFPGGIVADCNTSYADSLNILRAEAENGWFELSPAYEYEGKEGKTSKGKMDFPNIFEQVYQMDDFADCILNKKETKVPGEMGLRDVKIIEAIYKAAETGKKVELQLDFEPSVQSFNPPVIEKIKQR